MRHLFLAIPAGGPLEPETSIAAADVAQAKWPAGTRVTLHQSQARSLLARNFNACWCKALNQQQDRDLTHFGMLHADIAPESGWLLKLLDEMERVGADMLGAVVPIKEHSGRTSTALLDLATEEIRNLMVDELAGLPDTFDRFAFPGDQVLLNNTGCWVCDLTKPFWRECWFEIRDWIETDPQTGKMTPHTLPEDWNFSLQAHKLGARIFATQMITLDHYGRHAWRLPKRQPSQPVT